MRQVQQVDGVWKIEDGDRRVALHSRDPHREADAAIAAVIRTPSPDLVVVIGLGLGYLLDALERAAWRGRVLAVEPVAATAPLLLNRDITGRWLAEDRLRVLVAPAFDGASDAWPFFGDGATEPGLIINPVLERIAPESVAAARALVSRLKREAASNAVARQVFGRRYLLNTLQNLNAIASGGDVADLFNMASGEAAVIVGAGPSLDDALPWLRAIQDRALLISVDTAAHPLINADITPHIIVSVDPGEANARHLADIAASPDTCLVAEGSLDPLALDPFRTRTFFFNVSNHHPWPWIEQQGRAVGRLRAWGSVLTSAFDLALKMACDPIVFVGADLAYTGNRPYCRGVVFEEEWHRRADWGQPVAQQWADAIDRHPRLNETDVHGVQTRTAPHLVAFRNWLLEHMRGTPGRRFLNATGGGILAGDGITQLAPSSLPALLRPGTVPPTAISRLYRPRPNDVVRRGAQLLRELDANEAAAVHLVHEWTGFAANVAVPDIVEAITRGVSESSRTSAPRPSLPHPVRPEVILADSWLHQLAREMSLVPMRIPASRLTDWSAVGARIFYFRTMAARLIMCSLQAPDGSLWENGTPLKEAPSAETVVAGTYRTCRDELHFLSSDGSDPRWNGREYTLLVPPCIASLEALPLDEILGRRF